MHKSSTKCNETLGKWCKNKHGASKIMDTLETYQQVPRCSWQSKALDEAPYKLSGAIVKLASITFLSLAFSYWIDIPWFHN
jgi:hypothetical protein